MARACGGTDREARTSGNNRLAHIYHLDRRRGRASASTYRPRNHYEYPASSPDLTHVPQELPASSDAGRLPLYPKRGSHQSQPLSFPTRDRRSALHQAPNTAPSRRRLTRKPSTQAFKQGKRWLSSAWRKQQGHKCALPSTSSCSTTSNRCGWRGWPVAPTMVFSTLAHFRIDTKGSL